jgi:hypothetical protein
VLVQGGRHSLVRLLKNTVLARLARFNLRRVNASWRSREAGNKIERALVAAVLARTTRRGRGSLLYVGRRNPSVVEVAGGQAIICTRAFT